jgi:outer membrane receptor protein involved in Fe transport
VTSIETQFVRTMNTENSGDYVFNLLPPGTYLIRVTHKNFKQYDVVDVKVGAGDRTRVDVKMEVGSVSETVEVAGDAIPALQTDSPTVQDVVSETEVQDMPLNGRNMISVVQQAAGVNQGSPSSEAGGNRADDRRPGFTYAASGASDLSNNTMVDGLDNNEREQGFSGVRPSIDAISEIRVLTNDYSAEIGRTAGAVVNIITKAGTNKFHGSAYEYFRNDIFDAMDFFALVKPEYRQNVFGGSVGGPILKNKTFFFGDIEANRMIQGITQTTTVPTLHEEQTPGDFSDNGGFVVPTGDLTQVGLNYLKLFPAPNRSGLANNYTSEQNKTQYAISTDDRVDHQFSDRDSIFVRFGYNPVSTLNPPVLPVSNALGTAIAPDGTLGGGPSNTVSTNVQANYVHIFNQNLVLELKTGFTRINIHTNPLNYGQNLSSTMGLTNPYNTPDSTGLPLMWMLLGDYASIGGGLFVPIADANNTYQYHGALTYTHGRHNLKAGGAIIRRELNYLQDQWAAQGGFVFMPYGPYSNSLANLLSGNPSFSVRGDDLAKQGLRSWEPSAYVQDDWHAKSWLTLNLGLRWETYTPMTDAHNHFANFDMTQLKILIAGQGTSNSGGVKTDFTDFSPRVGFAATLGHGAVVRGGYGISYYPPVMQTQVENPNPPFDYVCFPCFGATFPTLPMPSASSTNPSGSVSALDMNLKNAYVHQFNLFLQKEIGANTISIGGVGEAGRRALYLRNADQPDPPGAGNPEQGYVYATQLPNLSNIQFVDNSGYSNYYGMEASFVRQNKHGLTFNGNYTWGHGLSNSVQAASTFTNPNPALVTSDPHYDYGNFPLDVRHRIAGTLTYELPFGKSLHGIRGEALGGWQASLLGFWQTGLPFTVTNGNAQINLPGVSTDRPNQTGSAALSKPTIREYFNTSVFSPQTLGTAGDERSDSVYGPRARALNISALKNFPIVDDWRLQFRAELFNVTNTPNFAMPGNVMSTTSTFGVISASAANMNSRQMQFALKLLF